MLIPVNVNIPGPSSPPHRKLPPQLVQFGSEELVLIELQGALEVEGNSESQLVGKLRVDPATKKPTILIGHHLLEGRLVNLAKPLAVLHRNDCDPSAGTDDSVDAEDLDSARPASGGEAKSWDIVAVVRKKMVFSKRPMPMVGKPPSAVPLSRIGSKA